MQLRELGDEGVPLGTVPIERLELEEGAGVSAVVDGAVHVDATPAARALSFAGCSVVLAAGDELPAEISFEVTGAMERTA